MKNDPKYWDELDLKAEQLEQTFADQKTLTVDQHDYVVNRLLYQLNRWPGLREQEIKDLNTQYKDVIFNYQEKEDSMSQTLRDHLNFTNAIYKTFQEMQQEIVNTTKYLHHTDKCYFIEKTSSGRRVEIDEDKDCNCGYKDYKERLYFLAKTLEIHKSMMEKLDKQRRDFIYTYG